MPPRSVLVPGSTDGVIAYMLGNLEAWTLEALSVVCDPDNQADTKDLFWLEFVTQAGNIIHRQILGGPGDHGYGGTLFLSAAPGSADMQQTDYWWALTTPGGTGDDEFWPYRSVGLPKLPLTAGCTVRVFSAGFWPLGEPTAPFSFVDAGTLFKDLHLWVVDSEDTAAALTSPLALPIYLQQSDASLIRPDPIPGRGD